MSPRRQFSTSSSLVRRQLSAVPALLTALLVLLFVAASSVAVAAPKASAKKPVASKATPSKSTKSATASKAAPKSKSKATAKPTAKGKAAKGKVAKGKVAKGKSAKASKGKSKGKKVAHRTDKGKTKVCSSTTTGKGKRKRTRKSCKRVKTFQGHGVSQSSLRTAALEKPSGELLVFSENLAEGVNVNIFKRDAEGNLTDEFDDAALAQLDEIFRCKRTQEVRAVDPKLYAQLSRILDHFRAEDPSRRIELVSGFRFAERDSSRHHHASAMDIRIKGVSIRQIYDYAEDLDGGGMGVGIYPHSGFVHVDFRAPGEPSYRWTDLSGPGSNNPRDKGKKSSKSKKSKPTKARPRTTPARRATS